MSYSRVLTIQDISCVGQCSLTVALPILSACGLETVILPSAVLSNHTAPGFSGFTFCDLTEELPKIRAQWEKENILFDAIYTGYLGSTKQVGYVIDIFNSVKKPGCLTVVDPAMADNGKLYVGFDMEYVKAMRGLCMVADILLPNLTEACLLADIPYTEEYDRTFIETVLSRLEEMGAKRIVLTGIGYEAGTTGVIVRENGRTRHYVHEKLPRSFHGTGDIYASAFVGAAVRGKEIYEAAGIAAEYTVQAMKNTMDSADEHWYGVKFETALRTLMDALDK